MNAGKAHLEFPAVTTARRFFESAIRRAQRDRFVRVELPAPVAAVDKLLLAQDSPGFLWDPPQGPLQFAGLGNCYRWTASKETNFDPLRERVRGISRVTDTIAAPGLAASSLRVFGGLPFSPTQNVPEEWRDFGRGAFAIPRWLYTRQTEGARLTFMDSGGRSLQSSHHRDILEEFDQIFSALSSQLSPKPTGPSKLSQQMSRPEWKALIESALSEIRRGQMNKVVLARVATVDSPSPFDPLRVLSQLSVSGGSPTRFAFRERHATFLGATPEKLVVRRGREVSTEALAGSIASSAPDALSALTASAKDQEEHRWVVQAVVRGLTPFCERLFIPDRAQVRRFGDVLHLGTPIEGHLAKEVHVLELVRALHPTPAVGGEPAAAALKWITEREPQSRGWYAGPIGWFDESGDGEFYVAIRSALLAGGRAFVYAGAGIVADSDPAAEYEETALKQRLLLRGLGARQ